MKLHSHHALLAYLLASASFVAEAALRGLGSDEIEECMLKVSLLTDNYPEETSFVVKDAFNKDVVDGDNFDTGKQTYNVMKPIARGHYNVIMKDSFGDGMCSGYGNGKYRVYLDDELIKEGCDFGAEEKVELDCGSTDDCNIDVKVNVKRKDEDDVKLDGLKWELREDDGSNNGKGKYWLGEDYTPMMDMGASMAAAKGRGTKLCKEKCYMFKISGKKRCPYEISMNVDGKEKLYATGGNLGCNEHHKICTHYM